MKKRLFAIFLSLAMSCSMFPAAVSAQTNQELDENYVSDQSGDGAIVAKTNLSMTITEGFEALTESTALPYSGSFELGGEGAVLYDFGGWCCYAELIKVDLTKGQILNMEFYGASDPLDTYIEIYRKEGDSFAYLNSYNNDNDNGPGESLMYIVPEDGEYYLAFEGYDEYVTGMCTIDIHVTSLKFMTLEEGFSALTETTDLPYSSSFELGGDGAVLYDSGDWESFAKLLKVDLSQGQVLNLKFYGQSSLLDTCIEIYHESNGSFTRVKKYDNDNSNSYGEEAFYTVPEDGVYYLVFRGYNEYNIGMCNINVSLLSTKLVTMEEGFAALTESTTLPYDDSIELSGEGAVLYDVGGWYIYAELMKVDLSKGQVLNLEFYGESSAVDTAIAICEVNGGRYSIIQSFDNNNKNYTGEKAAYVVPMDGTYYLIFGGYDSKETGMCDLKVHVETPKVMTLEEGFSALTQSMELPYSGLVELGGEGAVIYDYGGWFTYAELGKVDLSKGQILNLEFYGQSGLTDTTIEIYREENGSFTYDEYYDSDNLQGCGEEAVYIAPEDGTYYFALFSNSGSDQCVLNLNILTGTILEQQLDFSQENVLAPGEEDLWEWDADNKVLTLKDGFSLIGSADDLITLPDGSTIIVEGMADIFNFGANSIYGLGALTIKGTDPDTSCLTILYDDEDAIELVDDDSLTIENLSMDITAASDGMITDGDIIIQNAQIKIQANDEGLDPSGNAVIKDSEIEILSFGIGIDASDDIEIIDSKLSIIADESVFEADHATLSGNIDVQLSFRQDYGNLFTIAYADTFSIPGNLLLYGKNGNLLYSGKWDSTLFNASNVVVDGERAYRIVTSYMHDHVFDKEVISDQYLVSEATCTQPAVYYYSCECGVAGTDTFMYGEALGHKYENGVCTVCGAIDPDFKALIIAGANGSWQVGTKDALAFTSNAAFVDFVKVLVDGKEIDASNYTVDEGSSTVTLKTSYLETLAVGKHTLAIASKTGTAATSFTIQAAETDEGSASVPDTDQNETSSTQTGSRNDAPLWVGLAVICGLGIMIIAVLQRKKRSSIK